MPEHPTDIRSRRYALRRTAAGTEWFAGQLTRVDGETAIFHGYPTDTVPAKVLRRFRDEGKISKAEYERLVRELN